MKEELSEEAQKDLWQILDEAVGTPMRRRPEGFGITVTEYAEHHECGLRMARNKLIESLKHGWVKEVMLHSNGKGTVEVYYPENKV